MTLNCVIFIDIDGHIRLKIIGRGFKGATNQALTNIVDVDIHIRSQAR